MNTERLEGESLFEWKLRLCKAKLNKETDLDWAEIVEVLGLDVSADHLRKTAYGMIEYDEYIHGFGGVATTILSISDMHFPYSKDVSIFKEYVGKIDILQINGDLLDMASCSKFPKMFRSSPIEEMIGARQWLIDVIELVKPKKVVANFGNHELRFGAYLAKNLDNELQELMPETAFDYIFTDGFTHYDRKTKAKVKYKPLQDVFDDVEIEYTGTWFSQIGSVIFAHPKAFSRGIMKTASDALYWFRNEGYQFNGIVLGHTHRSGQYKIGNSMIYEQGACCQTEKMSYADGQLINSQKQGFIIVCLDDNENLIEEKTKLITLN